MIRARKLDLRGGSLKVDTQPYKQDVFARFIDWSTLTREEKNLEGIPTAKAFAEKYGISQNTILNWKKREDFLDLKRQVQVLKLAEETPDVLHGLKKRCIKYGMAHDVELFLLYVENWDRKHVLEILGEVKLGENDIRSLVALLPETKQKLFYDTLTELIAEAEYIRTHRPA